MHRLFVAIRPPAAIRSLLLASMGDVTGARWLDDARLHLTLRFIGEVDRHRASDIAETLETLSFAAFDIAISGTGCFDRQGRIDTLWAGVRPHAPLAQLHRKIDHACMRVGEPSEARAYLPHITLARFSRSRSGGVSEFLATRAALSSPAFPVDSFDLYESRLGHEGADYHLIRRYRAADA